MERLVEEALIAADIRYFAEDQPENVARLDFYLPDFNLFIEVKRFHSGRAVEQMSRATNVVLVQGEAAVRFFAAALAKPVTDH